MAKTVLLVDDRTDDISWLIDYLEDRGYSYYQVANEESAKSELKKVRMALDNDERLYAVAIVDVMMPVMDIMELVNIEEDFFEDSAKTGVRLCHYARKELGIREEDLPIVVLTSRSDEEEIQEELEEIDVRRIYGRVPEDDEGDEFLLYLDKVLKNKDS